MMIWESMGLVRHFDLEGGFCGFWLRLHITWTLYIACLG